MPWHGPPKLGIQPDVPFQISHPFPLLEVVVFCIVAIVSIVPYMATGDASIGCTVSQRELLV